MCDRREKLFTKKFYFVCLAPQIQYHIIYPFRFLFCSFFLSLFSLSLASSCCNTHKISNPLWFVLKWIESASSRPITSCRTDQIYSILFHTLFFSLIRSKYNNPIAFEFSPNREKKILFYVRPVEKIRRIFHAKRGQYTFRMWKKNNNIISEIYSKCSNILIRFFCFDSSLW